MFSRCFAKKIPPGCIYRENGSGTDSARSGDRLTHHRARRINRPYRKSTATTASRRGAQTATISSSRPGAIRRWASARGGPPWCPRAPWRYHSATATASVRVHRTWPPDRSSSPKTWRNSTPRGVPPARYHRRTEPTRIVAEKLERFRRVFAVDIALLHERPIGEMFRELLLHPFFNLLVIPGLLVDKLVAREQQNVEILILKHLHQLR